MRILLVFALAMLSGCVTITKRDANEISAADLSYAAAEIASYTADVLPVASSSLSLPASTNEDATDSPDPVALALRERGFAVFDAGVPDPAGTAHTLSYIASSLDSGLLILVTLDGQLTSRFYERDSTGSLAPASAFSRRITE